MSAVSTATRPRRTSIFAAQDAGGGGGGAGEEGARSARGWLLHARYVRGEHGACATLAGDLLLRGGGERHAHRHAYFVQGLVLRDVGRLQEALERFHCCVRLQPRQPEPLKHVADCLYRQGRYQLALDVYTEADKLSLKRDPEILCCLAECAAQLGERSRGVEYARAASEAGGGWGGGGGGERAAALLSRLLLQLGDTPGALAALDNALQSNACGAETLAAAGALRLRGGDPRRAFQLLGAALAQQPSHHPAALALAAMMLEHRDADAALARLRTALAARPHCVAAYADLGLALLAKRKFVAVTSRRVCVVFVTQAVTCLQRASTAAPLSARAAHNLGLALLMCKRNASAFCRLAAAAALHPDDARTVMLVGVALERLQDARADAAYARAARLAPADALVRYNLAARHARAACLPRAAEEAALASAALAADSAPDPQVASSLAALVALLRQAGLRVQLTPDSEAPSIPPPPPPPHIAPDEV